MGLGSGGFAWRGRMNEWSQLKDLGKPALTIAGLRIWNHSRESPALGGWEDQNWLVIMAVCEASGALVAPVRCSPVS
jgi:hypothetical protein